MSCWSIDPAWFKYRFVIEQVLYDLELVLISEIFFTQILLVSLILCTCIYQTIGNPKFKFYFQKERYQRSYELVNQLTNATFPGILHSVPFKSKAYFVPRVG